MVILPVLIAIFAPFSGKLSDKINPQILSALGMGFVTLGLFFLTFLNADTPIYMIGLSLFLIGIGYGLFSSPNTNTIMGSVPEEEVSSSSSAVATVRAAGQTMGMGILTLIFVIYMGNVNIVSQYYPLLIYSSQLVFTIAMVLAIIAVVASLVGLKSNDKYNS